MRSREKRGTPPTVHHQIGHHGAREGQHLGVVRAKDQQQQLQDVLLVQVVAVVLCACARVQARGDESERKNEPKKSRIKGQGKK